jgi:hypothetical protein
MARDSTRGIEPNAYYPQLNPLLGKPPFSGMPSGFGAVASLWRDLCRWLDESEGRFGTSTARQHAHFINVGWPMSQCLLRQSDRRRLTEFFRAVGLEPDEDIESEQLWVLFKAWARSGRGLSQAAVRVVTHASPEIEEQLAEIVKREYDAWEGELLDRHGRQRAAIALTLSIGAGGRRIRMGLSPRRPEGLPADAQVTDQAGRTLTLRAVSDEWYEPLETPVTRELLEQGISLAAPDFSFSYDADDVVPFRASLGAAAWVSVRQATLFEEHCILASAARRLQVANWLSTQAAGGIEVKTDALPQGWTLFRGVRFLKPAPSAPDELSRLAPRLHTATRLAGGLPLARELYLIHGEPDLWISVGEGQEATIAVDGDPLDVKGALEVRLSELNLQEGQHEIVGGGITRRFATCVGYPVSRPSGSATYGHVFERHRSYRPKSVDATDLTPARPVRGTIYVSGAQLIGADEDLPQALTEPALIPDGLTDYVVIGATPSDILTPIPPEKPRWLRTLVSAPSQFFDLPLPFTPQWVIARGATGLQVRPLAVEPAPAVVASADPADAVPRAWAEAIAGTAVQGAAPLHHAERWQTYLEAAAHLERHAGVVA